jgi:hypothetical protein
MTQQIANAQETLMMIRAIFIDPSKSDETKIAQIEACIAIYNDVPHDDIFGVPSKDITQIN